MTQGVPCQAFRLKIRAKMRTAVRALGVTFFIVADTKKRVKLQDNKAENITLLDTFKVDSRC